MKNLRKVKVLGVCLQLLHQVLSLSHTFSSVTDPLFQTSLVSHLLTHPLLLCCHLYFPQPSTYFFLLIFSHYSLVHFLSDLSLMLQMQLPLTSVEAKCVQKWMWGQLCCSHEATGLLASQESNERVLGVVSGSQLQHYK